MAEEEPGVRIGRLRWPVTLCTREQTADVRGTGIQEKIEGLAVMRADVQPVGGLTFWGSEQTDGPITHRIFMRWTGYLDQTFAVVQVTRLRPSLYRQELFRVRRVKELGGRKRFVLIEAELEKAEDI